MRYLVILYFNMAKRIKETVECEGRFSELREFLYSNALPLVLQDRTIVTEDDLKNMWELSQQEIVDCVFDHKDPYYFCNRKDSSGRVVGGSDCLRESPFIDYLSLVPLIESHMALEEGLVFRYSRQMGNSEAVSQRLEFFAQHVDRYFRTVLRKEPKDVVFLGGHNLAGYKISANFGIGTISSGGLTGGGVRSDSPFLLEIFQETKGRRGEYDLAAIVGFWAQNNHMVVSQMQPGRNAHFPSEVPFGIGCLRTAEVAAEKMGFEGVFVYSAKTHPIFRQYPSSSDAMKKEFVCIYDGSAKKLGYHGTRCSSYLKPINGYASH